MASSVWTISSVNLSSPWAVNPPLQYIASGCRQQLGHRTRIGVHMDFWVQTLSFEALGGLGLPAE